LKRWSPSSTSKFNTLVFNTGFVLLTFTITNFDLCFSSHKVYMKIQEVMMKQLGCLTWDQVTEEYPVTSSYKALSEYFIAFKDWVSIFSVITYSEYILVP
jgi:hypothetical protein